MNSSKESQTQKLKICWSWKFDKFLTEWTHRTHKSRFNTRFAYWTQVPHQCIIPSVKQLCCSYLLCHQESKIYILSSCTYLTLIFVHVYLHFLLHTTFFIFLFSYTHVHLVVTLLDTVHTFAPVIIWKQLNKSMQRKASSSDDHKEKNSRTIWSFSETVAVKSNLCLNNWIKNYIYKD